MPQKPSIVLVVPQMGENIGSAARAMLNFGLTDLRIVNPRDGWPSDRAEAMSSGALSKMPPVQVFENTADAIADLHHVYATTARPRDMVKPVITPSEAAQDIKQRGDQKTGILFGGERTGLHNDDVALANTIITIPANPDFTSINLGQAVLLVAYEWFQANTEQTDNKSFPAPMQDLNTMLNRLENDLEDKGFFRSPDMKPSTARNIRAMFTRSDLTEQEVRTMHGIISALTGKKDTKKGT